jgi:hypothetical protein
LEAGNGTRMRQIGLNGTENSFWERGCWRTIVEEAIYEEPMTQLGEPPESRREKSGCSWISIWRSRKSSTSLHIRLRGRTCWRPAPEASSTRSGRIKIKRNVYRIRDRKLPPFAGLSEHGMNANMKTLRNSRVLSFVLGGFRTLGEFLLRGGLFALIYSCDRAHLGFRA